MRSAAWAALALLAGACAPRAPIGPDAQLALEDCILEAPLGLSGAPAECGTLGVPENRAQSATGRTLALHIAVVRSVDRDPPPRALFVLAGGPGQAATDFYASVAPAFARMARTHDIVLVDQRGTGASNRLDCARDTRTPAEPDAIRARAAACVAALDADLREYTTSVAVEDLDAVRAVLGFERIDLYGVSYGTRVAQQYLRRHPTNVGAIVLDGVVPPEVVLGPDTAPEAQRVLTAIFARCKADSRCAAAFPKLASAFAAWLEQLRSEPLAVTVPDPGSAEPVDLEFGADELIAAVRLMTYSDETAAMLPLLLHAAAVENDPKPLAAQYLMVAERLEQELAEGMHNAVVCTEDLPFVAPDASTSAPVSSSYLGGLQLDALRAACSVWPRGTLDPDLHAPLSIAVPALLLSGELDPITPPRYAERTLAGARQALHLVVPGHGHGQLLEPCVNRIVAAFLAQHSIGDLDTRCVDTLQPAPFFLTFTGTAP